MIMFVPTIAPLKQVRRGFTLVELLLAMAIFFIGFVAVASLFPVGILLQRNTVDDINADWFVTDAKALIIAKGIDETKLEAMMPADGGPNDGIVQRLDDGSREILFRPDNPPALLDAGHWTLNDRSHGSYEDVRYRELFWVPLVRDAYIGTGRTWWVYLFVVRGENDEMYEKESTDDANQLDPEIQSDPGAASSFAAVPAVRNMNVTTSSGNNTISFDNDPRLVRPGDKVLTDNGYTYRAIEADDGGITIDGVVLGNVNSIWYAHPGTGTRSTFVDIVILIDSDDTDIVRPLTTP